MVPEAINRPNDDCQSLGIYYGLALPRSAPELLGAGANWLSRAFWQAKTFPEDSFSTHEAHEEALLLFQGIEAVEVTFFVLSQEETVSQELAVSQIIALRPLSGGVGDNSEEYRTEFLQRRGICIFLG